ncbi:recombination-associated protein RdgC [Shewanella aestuarii]|uniref:Recombination-associated protein RdgC n=1 Tax=Shewanella aestuarii TaxID=1028752 RepID=A0A6G9QRC5_9GAMM|nr:recombination-associated protein RdgC [Shewanella aestuarii]QIR16605.1 recombination-associated protein RdgC [Shewanella aestuarii]
MFSSFCIYKLDPDCDGKLLEEAFWDGVATKHTIVPFSDLPESVAKGVDRVHGFCTATPQLGDKSINFHSSDFTILNYCIETKKVKPAILKRTIAKLEKKALAESGQPFVSKEQKKEIKALARIMELKRAVEDRSETLIVLNRSENWLVVGAGSDKKCDEIMSTIRTLIDSFPVTLAKSSAASTIFTDWVKSGVTPDDSRLNDSCTLMSNTLGSSATYKHQSVATDEEILKNIEKNKEVVSLSLSVGDESNEFGVVSFNIADTLKVSGFKFKALKKDKDSKDESDNADANIFLFLQHLSTVYHFIEDNIINYTVDADEFS